MLNRIFVALGILVILAIGAAFVVPRFIQWGDYRERLESMAAGALGTEVAIGGDIELTLLPQPRLVFSGVRVGPQAAPVLEVGKVAAEFSLFDFLRDQYRVTRLELEHPVVSIAIGADGSIASGIAISDGGGESNVSIANAELVGGSIRLTDARAETTTIIDRIDGQLRLDAMQGPFGFQGQARLDGNGFGVRVGAGKLDANGATALSLYLKANDGSFSLESNGSLQTGAAPKYVADLTYRQPPPKAKDGETADVGRGDLLLEGKLEAATDRVLLSSYTLQPDENRSAMRLTGAAEMKLGKAPSFNAVVSGGVVALPPRDATAELTDTPYELVRLLGEIPLPPVPAMPGTIGLDITELNLRAVSLRDLRLDAVTDTHSWSLKDFSATLPGGAKLGMTGTLTAADGRPAFAGSVRLVTSRLDLLAQLWRKPAPDNPLFNMAGSLDADLALSGDTLRLSSGTLVIDGINQGFGAEIGFGMPRHLAVDAHFTTLGEAESAALAALMPDVTGSGSFGATFPKGALNLTASKAVLFGLQGTELVADADWEGGVVEFSRLSAADFGGATFDARLTAFGTLAKPEISGNGTLKIADGAPVVDKVLEALGTPQAVGTFLRRSLPATLAVQLDAPSGDGGQSLDLTGKLGTADAKLTARLGAGIASALSAPITASLDLKSGSPRLVTAQLGLGSVALFGDRTPLHLTATIEGVPSNSYETHVSLTGGGDRIAFDGNVVPGDFSKVTGDGALEMALTDPSVVSDLLGVGGLHIPPLAGKARLGFTGADSFRLSGIDAGGATGDLALERHEGKARVTGQLAVPALDLQSLLPVLMGPASVATGEGGLWPDGPIDVGAAPRSSEGRIDVTTPAITAGAIEVSAVRFGLDWNAQALSLRNLSGKLGGGSVSLDATVCCASATQPMKDISGRLVLGGVPLAAIAPAPIAAGLKANISASASFDGSGATPAEVVAALSGAGSYTLTDFSAAGIDPGVFGKLAALGGVLDMAPEALTTRAETALGAAPFEAPTATGSFTIAGGVLRSPNLAIASDGARLFGSASLTLPDLALNARYALTPTAALDPAGAVDSGSAEIDVTVTGPLWAPAVHFDVSPIVDGMKIRANEVELARLEQLRAEAEARAAEQARLATEKQAADEAAAKQAADDAAAAKKAADDAAVAKKAADDAAAAKKAADDAAAAKKAADDAKRTPEIPPPSFTLEPAPMDLGL